MSGRLLGRATCARSGGEPGAGRALRLLIAVVATGALAAPAGCGPTDEAQAYAALEAELAGTRHVTRPAPSAADQRAERLPLEGAAPHSAVVRGRFGLQGADGARSVLINREIQRGGHGEFYIHDTRYWADPYAADEGEVDGREIIYDGTALAVKRAWGPWMLRETLGGQEERLLREAYDVAGAVLGSWRPYLMLVPDGHERMVGLDVTWFRVELDRGVAPRPMEPGELAALRAHDERWPAWFAATHKPFEASGRIALRGKDDPAGELVAGEIELKGGARWGAVLADFGAMLSYAVSDLPPKPTFTIPEDALPATRERPWRMVQDVMGESLDERWTQ